MKKIFTVALFGATLLYAEISAFDAGNIMSDSAYGLTSNEKLLKEKLDSLGNENIQINTRINEINERIEGLESTLEGINSQYTKSNFRLNQVQESSQDIENNLSTEIQKLKIYVEESRKIQEVNNKQVKKILIELSSLVDAINANYISKSEFSDKNLSNVNDSSILVTNAKDINNSVKNNKQENKIEQIDDSWKKKNNNEILELAIKDIDKNAFGNSKEKLDFLINKEYQLARIKFWLGEIEYKKENYHNAIAYYKQSSSLSVKGDYFPKLLYHTAISLDKIGDIKTANAFYKALKTNYPNSPQAKELDK